jgi:hypothetical protein
MSTFDARAVQALDPRTRVTSIKDLDCPHVRFIATWWLGSEKTISEQGVLLGGNTTTFKTDNTVVPKLLWLELHRNLSHAYIEKRSLDGQLGTGADTNIDVEIPINRVIFFEFVRLVFDIGAILENELEVGGRALLDKIDRDILQMNI